MEIVFIASTRMPTERAMGQAIMKQCEAFAQGGNEVTLIVPSRKGTVSDDSFTYYGIPRIFTIKFGWCLEIPWESKISFYIRQFSFFVTSALIVRKMPKDAVLYSREPESLAFFPSRKRKFIELHHLFGLEKFGKVFLKHFDGIVTITEGLKEDVRERYGYPEERMIVAPSGLSVSDFDAPESKESSRARLGIPNDARVALYIGSLEAWKGIGTFLEASTRLKNEGILPVVIGGSEVQVTAFKEQYPDVLFLGQRPSSELSNNQQAGDVLVVPNTAKEEISARHTSPLKVLAHMASGVPIVASSLSSIRELLNGTNAILVLPDDSDALITGIRNALGDKAGSQRRVEQAKKDVLQYDWKLRAEKVLSFIKISD